MLQKRRFIKAILLDDKNSKEEYNMISNNTLAKRYFGFVKAHCDYAALPADQQRAYDEKRDAIAQCPVDLQRKFLAEGNLEGLSQTLGGADVVSKVEKILQWEREQARAKCALELAKDLSENRQKIEARNARLKQWYCDGRRAELEKDIKRVTSLGFEPGDFGLGSEGEYNPNQESIFIQNE